MSSFDVLNSLDPDTSRAVFAAISILSILFLIACISKWILYGLTAIFTLFAIFLTYKQFIAPRIAKKRGI